MIKTARKNYPIKRVQSLGNELSAILLQPGELPGEPFVVEDQIAQTKSLHVIVIWDEWKDLSQTDRSEIIMDAYAKAKRLATANITVAMGLTSEEALRAGFLTYGIVAMRRHGDKASLAELTRAMVNVGGVVLKIGDSTQLRFPTREQAEDAYRKLSQNLPGPYWAIVQDHPTSD
jgi:hypothetical protein